MEKWAEYFQKEPKCREENRRGENALALAVYNDEMCEEYASVRRHDIKWDEKGPQCLPVRPMRVCERPGQSQADD